MVCRNPPEMFLPSLAYVTLCFLKSSQGNLLKVFSKSWQIEASFRQSLFLTTASLMLMSRSGRLKFESVSSEVFSSVLWWKAVASKCLNVAQAAWLVHTSV